MHKAGVIIADGQYLIRYALRKLLERHPSTTLIGEARNGQELALLIQEKKPDLLIADFQQQGHFQIGLLPLIREQSPSTRIMVISGQTERSHIHQILEHGIDAFLTKHCDEAEISDAIEAVFKGERFFCSQVIDVLLEKSFPKNNGSCTPITLSSREIEIVQLTARGLIAKQIAETLNISTHTVYTHRKNIMQKLNVRNASELVRLAVNKGWVERD